MNKLVILMALLLGVAGCNNKMQTIADDDLADSMHECRASTDQSPGMAIKCDNVTRECARRRDSGHYVC